MLIAYNNDVEFRSRMYHIQTEDNGLKDGHITTNVFYSGQILDSKSTSYKDKIFGVDDPEIQTAIIKELMTKQHQAFYAKLIDGTYEARVQAQVSKSQSNQSPQPSVHGARTTSRLPASQSSSSSGINPAAKIASNNFDKISPNEVSGLGMATKSNRPDILRASSQQVGSVSRPVGRINTNQSAKGAFAQPNLASASDFSKSSAHVAISVQPQADVNRIPSMQLPPTPAVQREKSLNPRHIWLGFRWPDEDLSIDGLVSKMLCSM